MKKSWKSILYLVIALVVVAVILYPRLKEESVKKEAQAKGPSKPGQTKAPVTVMVLETSSLDNNIEVVGSLMASEQVTLQPEMSGKVIGIYFKEGEQVTKGQKLIQLQTDDLDAQLKKLQINLQLANTIEERQKQLLAREAISAQEYDQSVNSTLSLKADIANLKATIAKASITAPFSGTIGLRAISEGAFITPQTKIAELVATNPIKLEFAIPGKYANEVKIGSTVSFTLEGNRTKAFQATVYATANSIDPSTRTLTVRATTNNAGNQLKPGSFINVQLTLSKSAGTILVPTEAVVPSANGLMVFLKQQNLAQPVNIIIGTRTSTQVQVFEGLKAGDTLITTGTQFVKPGSELNIVTLANAI